MVTGSPESDLLGAGECSSINMGLLLLRSIAVHIALCILAPPSGRISMYMLAACTDEVRGEAHLHTHARSLHR